MWCKTQIVCLLILGYIGIQFIRDGQQLNHLSGKSNCNHIFDVFFIMTEVALLFDGITACTVNYVDVIPHSVNLVLHLGMFGGRKKSCVFGSCIFLIKIRYVKFCCRL